MLFFVGIIVTLIITMFGTPSYTAPMLVGTNTRTHGLFQEVKDELEDPESIFGPDIDRLTPAFNDIASMIISRLIRDPDPTTLETANKYIEKAKSFIEPVAKFINPSNKESKEAMHLIGKFFSSLKEMTGSDDKVVD